MGFHYKSAGDLSVLVKIGSGIDEHTNELVTGLLRLIEKRRDAGFEEAIPGYNTLLVSYDPLKLTYEKALSLLQEMEAEVQNQRMLPSRTIEIPVLYGGKWGQDLESVAAYHGLMSEEVISIHSSSRYLVYFMGFSPGFPFLGGMPKEIATPRLETPRVSILAGSVGIANHQTGIYPVASPGGWRLIGRTPVKLFSPENEQHPFLLQPADYVKFKKIDSETFQKIEEAVEAGTYRPVITGSDPHERV